MDPIWLMLGAVLIVGGIFNRQLRQFGGLPPWEENFLTPHLRRSVRATAQITRWLLTLLGASFVIQGLGSTLPNRLSGILISFLLGVVAVLLLVLVGNILAHWKTR